MNQVPYKVILPPKIVEKANGDVEKFKKLVRDYINKGYPHYRILRVKDKFIECEDTR